MFSRILATVAIAASTALPAWCQDTAAKPGAAPAADTDAQAHEFVKSKVDKTMYTLGGSGLKSAIMQTDMTIAMMGDAPLKSKYVWQADPPRDKFALDADKLPPQMGMMKPMLEENLKDVSRNFIETYSQRWKDLKLSMAKTDDGNVSITLPEKKQNMGPMGTMTRQETQVFTPEGKLVRTETKVSTAQGDRQMKSTVSTKEVGGKWLVTGREDTSAQGGGTKTEITFEEKDGFQVPVQSKQTTQMGDQVVKFTFTINPKLTDADFADAAKKEG